MTPSTEYLNQFILILIDRLNHDCEWCAAITRFGRSITIELLTHTIHFSQIYARSDICLFRSLRNTIHMQIAQVNINILTEPVHYLSTENVILIAQYMDMDM